MEPHQRKRAHWLAWLVFVLATAGTASGVLLFRSSALEVDLHRALEQQQEAAQLEAAALRFRLEAEVLSTIYLITSLSTYLGVNPEPTIEEYHRVASSILQAKPSLVNIAAAPDMVVRYIYPVQGNEAALGLDYRRNPEQRAAAMQVKELGTPVVAGPLELVQGGIAIIGRIPVYVDESGDSRFWGIVSAPVYLEELLAAAGAFSPGLDLQISLRGKDGKGSEGETFFGEASLFEKKAIRLPVRLTTGSWELGAIPKDGWITTAPNAYTINVICWMVGGLVISLLALLLVYVLALQRRHEVEASVSRAKSRFLSTMSHEIRTPLNGINGVAQLLEMTDLDEEQRDLTETLIDSTKSLSDLLTDILSLNRLESERYPVSTEVFEFDVLIAPVLQLIEAQAKAKGIAFHAPEIPKELKVMEFDPIILRQVLWNLLSNAVKFTPKGEVRLKIQSITFYPGAKPGIGIEVADTGIGVAKERQQAIFDDFVQEDDSTTRKFGGAGLGLAIVKRLVNAVGGSIDLTSAKGEGSRFQVRMPLGSEKLDRIRNPE
ncbi:ATP-binding protein [Pelagicoccus sp. SDUM812003]|uniref:sensor histidine kinase n=1 Tax=Pelagicoccus sp. SDUM812003 TaxID=3041267 RepID=UPI00280E394B|nr:ATP-binding protein [Pelagicoccus sp. SDUM812003]MDQ8203535.1 ATP-binding protein [Pelagicoccus sp. SDUM812003]